MSLPLIGLFAFKNALPQDSTKYVVGLGKSLEAYQIWILYHQADLLHFLVDDSRPENHNMQKVPVAKMDFLPKTLVEPRTYLADG